MAMQAIDRHDRLATRIGGLSLPNPIICGSGEPVMTEAGIRAALAAGAAGVIAKSVNEQPAAARQLDQADYAFLARDHMWPRRACRCSVVPASRSAIRRSGLARLPQLDQQAPAAGRFVAASLVLGNADAAERIAGLARAAGLRVFELNVGAPHASEAAPGVISQETDPARLAAMVTSGARRRSRHAALGQADRFIDESARAGVRRVTRRSRCGGDDGPVHGRWCLTSTAWRRCWARRPPMAGHGHCRSSAVSWRSAVVPLAREYPLLGTNGVRSGADVARMALAGASATELLSVVMHEGFGALTRIIGELEALLTARGLDFPI